MPTSDQELLARAIRASPHNGGTDTMVSKSWRELIATDLEGQSLPLVEVLPEIEVDEWLQDGSPRGIDGWFLSAPGEEPDWDTPKIAVDWTGFRNAVAQAGTNAN